QVEEAKPQSVKDRGSTGRRVKLIVLPGDATVEVNGNPVRRRDGIIELLGKVDETRRIRVSKDKQSIEQDVTIQESGASPPLLDLNAHPEGRPGGSDAGAPGGDAGTRN